MSDKTKRLDMDTSDKVLIVLTILVVAWIGYLFSDLECARLEDKIDRVERKLERKLENKLENKLEDKIDRVERKLRDKIDWVERAAHEAKLQRIRDGQ